MPRAIWSGSVSFGLVNVPVMLFSAVSHKEVRYHLLHDADRARVKQKWVCSADGMEVSRQHTIRGYEVSPNRLVPLTQEELEQFDPHLTRTIEVENFVDLEGIDPIYYQDAYYLVPGKNAARPYQLLLSVMKESGRVAIGQIVLRNRQHLCAIRPFDGVLVLSSMLYQDEIVPRSSLEGLEAGSSKPKPQEMAMAKQLVETLTSKFEPDRYKDEYRRKVLEFIRRKGRGEKVTQLTPKPGPAKVIDLVEALKASLARQSKSETRVSNHAKSQRHSLKRHGT